MISIPDTPFVAVQIKPENEDKVIQSILARRLMVSSPANISSFISSLEDYLNFIYKEMGNIESIHNYKQILSFAKGMVISNECPWKLIDTQKKINKWTLNDEIILVFINIAISYHIRSNELITSALKSSKDDKIWLNSFKLFKKALEHLNFLKEDINSLNNNIFETSLNFIKFIDSMIQSSIQFTFLSKAIWTLKQVDYDISLNNTINYSTLSRISIFIKDQLEIMINILRLQGLNYNNYSESVVKLNKAFIGVFLSIENYKQDKMGISIGFLNLSIENIALNTSDEDDSKVKKQLIKFKNKLKVKKLKINKQVYNNLSNDSLKITLLYLFELIEILNLKYNLENNQLNFEQIIPSTTLFESYLPTGRNVPLSDLKTWNPIGNIVNNETIQYY